MPVYAPSYAPVDGDTLSPAGLNQNIYRVTSGRSIYEISNGHIESVNFDAAFSIQPHHVRPGQAGEALSVGSIISADLFSDLNTSLSSTEYTAVVGACLTFYQRYDVAMAIFSASGFMSVWRQFNATNGAFGTRLATPEILIATFIQSSPGSLGGVGHTSRSLPQTVSLDLSSNVATSEITMTEARNTRHFNLMHPRVSGGTSPCGPLQAGWHTFGLACLIPQNLAGQDTSTAAESLSLVLDGTDDERPQSFYQGIHRIRFYVRNAMAVRLL